MYGVCIDDEVAEVMPVDTEPLSISSEGTVWGADVKEYGAKDL